MTLPYDVLGPAGRPPILTVHGLVSSSQHWRSFTPHYAAARPVVTWDYRGHGNSSPPPARGVSVAQFADDAHAVWSAAAQAHGFGPAIVTGLSFGVQVSLELWRRHPEAVRALVLICGTAGHPFAHVPGANLGGTTPRRAVASLLRGMGDHPALVRPMLALLRSPIGQRLACELAFVTGGANRAPEMRGVLGDLFAHVGGLPPALIADITASYLEHDAFDVLPTITVPTLIIAGDRDQLTPVSTAARMRDAIPNSQLVVFAGNSHLVQVEDPTGVHQVIDRFLADHAL
ncbi:MAG: alpha/beta hydrolase [Proteobacteria bacterium]|nr:alpha/beta hydrolase [Pseudomonadota bacterium]